MPWLVAVRKLHCRERMDRHRFTVEFEVNVSHPSDGWHAVVADEPSIRIHGSSKEEALAKAKALALRMLADRLEHEDAIEVSDAKLRG
jgi:predicted RNase H-like HicB family nuclease